MRGALGTYAKASVGVVLLLALALWLGPWSGRGGEVRVELLRGSCTGATLDDGLHLFELAPGDALAVPPGHYLVTLFGPRGETRRETIDVAPDDRVVIGVAASFSDEAPPAR